jgi:predicted transposase YdaD
MKDIKGLNEEEKRILEISVRLMDFTHSYGTIDDITYLLHKDKGDDNMLDTIIKNERKQARKEGKLEGRIEGKSEGRKEGWIEGISEGREEGWSEGMSEGWIKGKNEGRLEGWNEGKDEGKLDSAKKIARNMLKKGFDIELIMTLTELSKEQINSLL